MSQYQSNYQQQKVEYGTEHIYEIFDFLFPGSNTAKLIKVHDAYAKNFPYKEILERLSMENGAPVVNIIGGKSGQDRNKLYAGIARACFNTDAVIIDNSITSGVEKHSMRKGLKLIGVAPDDEVQYPKVNSTYQDPYEICAGHTHLFLLNNKEQDLRWTQESLFKITLALRYRKKSYIINITLSNLQKQNRIAEGDYQYSGAYQRVVHVFVGDSSNYIDEIKLAIKFQQPIIVVPGSEVCNRIIQGVQSQNGVYRGLDSELAECLTSYPQYFFMLLDSSSDEVAQYIHFFLTVTPYFQSTPILYQRKKQNQSEEQDQNGYNEDDYYQKSKQQQQQKKQQQQKPQQQQQQEEEENQNQDPPEENP
ncbi:hypothetical protein ABPG72_007151 [Tetrahymena utriculariae]